MNHELYQHYYPASVGDHRLLSTRGCPHSCAYCCNSVFHSMYQSKFLRLRSVESVIDEIRSVKQSLPYIRSFKIMDDSFTVNSLSWIQDFSQRYRQEIGLPFFCLVSPLTINAEKLSALVEAGLRTVQMGLQSGSDHVNQQIYRRHVTSHQFLSALRLIEHYHRRLKLIVDVIVDNPYETSADLLESIKVLNQIRKPFNLSVFSLVFYPGTALYQRALQDGQLTNPEEYLAKQFHLLHNRDLNKIIFLTQSLPSSKINQLLADRDRHQNKIYIALLYFLRRHKNRLPTWLVKGLSCLKHSIQRQPT